MTAALLTICGAEEAANADDGTVASTGSPRCARAAGFARDGAQSANRREAAGVHSGGGGGAGGAGGGSHATPASLHIHPRYSLVRVKMVAIRPFVWQPRPQLATAARSIVSPERWNSPPPLSTWHASAALAAHAQRIAPRTLLSYE